MINRKFIFNIIFFLVIFSGCKKDFLEFPYTEGPVPEDVVWGIDRNARGYLNFAYRGLGGTGYGTDRYNLSGGAILADASDEAVCSDLSNPINRMNNGTWAPSLTFDDQYSTLYTSIRMTNEFLAKSPGSGIYPASDITGLRGEAFFLRAMYHFELFKRYGRIVLATRSFSPTENLNLPRNSVDEVVKQIGLDCDSAIAMIPAVYNGSGTVSPYDDGSDPFNRGRATKTVAMALKSRLLLYYASPLYNEANDLARWQNAANAAKTLIDLNKHALLNSVDYTNLWNYSNAPTQYNKEVIFATTALLTNAIESNNAPVGFTGGLGRTNPTQDLVDAFEMTNGKPISDPTSGYNPANPYLNRDPRLNRFIVYNGSTFKTGTLSRAVETFDGGLDNPASNPNATKTGYYMRKFLSDVATYNVTTPATVRRPWVIFRYAETLLNYAEALNEAVGASTEVYNAVNQIRVRAGMPVLPAGLSQVQMRDRIRNERRVELCFEDHRFFDVRRWMQGNIYFNGAVRGMRIIKNGASLTYTPFTVENRVFLAKNYLYPIALNELNTAPALQQNPGY
ncbi:MAG: hypothetical protein JWN76_3247 [Chitinophagaceae bacterium]|nr:hypothetical protein [Chitinophagaceae bacterium]